MHSTEFLTGCRCGATKKDTATDACGSIVAQGYISTRLGDAHGGEDVPLHPPPNYTLLSVDLRNATCLLAYLPRSNTTELLGPIYNVLSRRNGVGLLEVSFVVTTSLLASPIVHGYTQHYVQQFHDKLHRGRQSQSQPQQHKLKQQDEIVMEPIGADCASVEQWLLTECGFYRASSRLAGTVAANTSTISVD
eukprot:scaffold76485_cov55-Attheya_sp.AAC.2